MLTHVEKRPCMPVMTVAVGLLTVTVWCAHANGAVVYSESFDGATVPANWFAQDGSQGPAFLGIVDDSGGIGTGNALSITAFTRQGTIGMFDETSIENVGDSIQMSFDVRLPSFPDNSGGLRIGLYHDNDGLALSSGYRAAIGTGANVPRTDVQADGGDDVNGDIAFGTNRENPPGFMNFINGITDTDPHSFVMSLTRTTDGVLIDVRQDGASNLDAPVEHIMGAGAGVPTPLQTRFNQVVFSTNGGIEGIVDNVEVEFLVAPSAAEWNSNISGDWHLAGNWSFGVVPNANDQAALFGAAITSPQTIFTNEPTSVKTIQFDTANKVAIAGTGTITLDADTGNAQVDVLGGSHEMQAPLSLADNTDVSAAAGANIDFNNAINLNGNTLTTSGEGQVNINHSATGGTVSNAGTLGTAGSSELSSLNSTGILDIDIGGTGGDAFDSFTVSGTADITGSTLDVDLADGFSLSGTETFTVLTAGTLSAAGVTLGGSAASQFDLVTTATDVMLQAIGGGGVTGDYNGDKVVNAADYVLWRDTLGSTTDLRADGDGSNTVDHDDYAFWRARFGSTGGAGSGAGAVPEPAALMLVLAAAIVRLGCRYRNF